MINRTDTTQCCTAGEHGTSSKITYAYRVHVVRFQAGLRLRVVQVDPL